MEQGMKPSEIISAAHASLMELGHGHGKLLDDNGSPCLLGALSLGAGYELTRGCNRIDGVPFSVFRTGTLGLAVDAVAQTIRPDNNSDHYDAVSTVWMYNDAPRRKSNDVLDILHRAELLAKEREL